MSVVTRRVGWNDEPVGIDMGKLSSQAVFPLLAGIADGLPTHIFTVGGPDAALTGRVLQQAVRWLPRHRGSKLEIVVVTSPPIPDNVRQALREKGRKFREVERRFPEPLPEKGLTRGQSPGRRL